MTILEELPQLTQFQLVTVLVKVICIDEPIEVPGGKMKQDVQVGDSTATARVTLWEKEIGKVIVGKSYRLRGMVVREYQGVKFLSTAKENSEIEETDDVGPVKEKGEVEGGSRNWVRIMTIVNIWYM